MNGFGTPGSSTCSTSSSWSSSSSAGCCVISTTTPGLGGLGDFGDWWTEPIVFQKFAVWTLLWEILGLGSGSMPLALRFSPMIGGVLYWLRPGTVRLPPWPDKVPLTRGTRRTRSTSPSTPACSPPALYLLVVRTATPDGFAAARPGRDRRPARAARRCSACATRSLPRRAARGLRLPAVVSLFPLDNLIVGWQFVFVFIWWGAAASKLNRHFPFVVSVMVSNTPWNRSRRAKAQALPRLPGGPAALAARRAGGPPRAP